MDPTVEPLKVNSSFRPEDIRA